jgi:hypothetical protein
LGRYHQGTCAVIGGAPQPRALLTRTGLPLSRKSRPRIHGPLRCKLNRSVYNVVGEVRICSYLT